MTDLRINKTNTAVSLPKTATHVGFRETTLPAQQSDTTEISTKKKNNRLGLKLILGCLVIGGSVFAWIKLHKPDKAQEVFNSEFKNIENIRKNLSEIFEKDLSKKEADEFAKNYKKICEIKDDNEYAEKLFEQLKKDYGFENSHIKLRIEDFNSANAPDWAALHTDLGHLVRISRVNGKIADREFIFHSLFHELKHHKQFEIAIAADKTAFEDALAHKKLKEYTKEQINSHGGEEAMINWLKEQSRPNLQPEFDRIEREIGQIPKDSPRYKKGLEYIDAKRNYIQESEIFARDKDYKNNILEVEAYKIEELAKEIFGWLK